MREAYSRLWEPNPAHGIVLTDDYNPVDFYDAANREKFRRTLALSMRGSRARACSQHADPLS